MMKDREMELKIHNCKKIYEDIALREKWLDYLEKRNSSDLGDMTDAGKLRNAGYNNYTLYAEWYRQQTGENYQAQPYCATGESMGYVQAYGLKLAKKLLGGDLFYNCEQFYQKMKKEHPDRLHDTAKVGDTVLFYNGSRHHHTGHVIKELTNGFVTEEENTSSGNNVVVPNGGATTRKSYTYDKVSAVFYRPPYAAFGISTTKEETVIEKYAINTDTMFGLIVEVDKDLNIRRCPDVESEVIGQLHRGDSIKPTYKAFDERGVRWYYIPEVDGWVSGNYLRGWIQESNGRWWYLLKDGGWYAGVLKVIDGEAYIFDDAGYMVTEPTTIYPDKDGILRYKPQ